MHKYLLNWLLLFALAGMLAMASWILIGLQGIFTFFGKIGCSHWVQYGRRMCGTVTNMLSLCKINATLRQCVRMLLSPDAWALLWWQIMLLILLARKRAGWSWSLKRLRWAILCGLCGLLAGCAAPSKSLPMPPEMVFSNTYTP